MNPHGKTAIITGAGSGLGLATCRVLAQAGASVWGLERDVSRAGDIEACAPGVTALTVDVSSESSVREAIAMVVERTGALHISVNCAGILRAARTVSGQGVFPLAAWDEVIAVNLTGTFNVVRFAAQAMSANVPDSGTGERGVIVNVASGAATQGQIGQAAYSASKAGVVGMTLPVARDLAPHAIRVVAIAPGLFETAMAAGMSKETREGILERMALYPRRLGRPEEFARLVRHVVENEYLNATSLDLDAGTRMTAR